MRSGPRGLGARCGCSTLYAGCSQPVQQACRARSLRSSHPCIFAILQRLQKLRVPELTISPAKESAGGATRSDPQGRRAAAKEDPLL